MLTKFDTKTSRVKGLSFHPKRPWLLASLHNGSVQIWDYRMGTVVDTYNEHDGPVRGCAFHPTQPLFATCGDDNKVRVFNFQQKKCLFVLSGHQDYIRSVSFHHESPWLMTASDDQTIRIWNWQSRSCVAQLTGHSHYVMCAQFHPKDDLVVSASLDQTIRVWDISYLKRKGSMTPVDDGGRPNQIDLFASSDGQVKFVLEGHDRGVNWVQFHPTKPLIVSGSDDRSVKLWRYNDSRAWETDTFRGHFNNVSCVVFHPTQDLILSASEDKTVRVWDYSKRGAQSQTFRRENDRYWMLAVHPTLGTFAAGHDCGLQVFKLERERPPYILIDGNNLFYLKGATMIRRDLDKSSAAAETALVTLPQAPNLPALLDYSAPDKAFLISYGNEFELVSRTSRHGLGSHAMFLGGGKFLVFDKADQLLYIKSITDGSTIGAITAPFTGLEHVFAAPDGCVLLVNPTTIAILDLDSGALLAEAPVPRVKRVSWSPDNSRVALMSKKGVVLMDRMLQQTISSTVEPVSIKSGVWASKTEGGAPLFFYTTPHHLKYMLPSGETGIVCTIENPLYLVRVRGDLVQALDRQGQLVSLRVDPAEWIFKLALLEGDMSRVMTIIQGSNLVGQSVISYLRQHGYAQIALQFVDDPMGRFELALECAEWEVAREAAVILDRPDVWQLLASQARRLGFPSAAMDAYAHTKPNQGLCSEGMFLSVLTGTKPDLGKVDPSTGIQGAMLLGDTLSLGQRLEEMGLHSLAYLAYRSAGVASDTKCPPSAELPEQSGATPLTPVRAMNPSAAPWPMARPLRDAALPAPPPLEPPKKLSIAPIGDLSPMADKGGWDDGEEIRMSHGSMPSVQDDFADFVEAPTNPLLQTAVPGLHLLAGSIESAKKLLATQAGIVDFSLLDPLFNEASQRNVLGSTVNRFEDVDPVFSLADIQDSVDAGLQATTEGRFLDSIASFERCLHLSLLVVSLESGDKENLQSLITEAREYLLGLKMELARKAIIASNTELAGPTATRVLELACYFTACKLRPAHLVLALRSAMTLAFKLKQVSLSARMAQRLLDLNPAEPIAIQARKVLSVATQHQSTGPALDLQYDDHLDFDLDAAKFGPIYLGQPAIECPHCGALYAGTSEKSTVCRVCRVAAVGASATGLQISP